MLTIVTLLLLPAVLCMSIFSVFQLPQTFLSGGLRLNRRRRRTAAVVLAATYCALTAYTVLVLYTAGRTRLVFEWVLFHSIERVGRNGP